MADFTDWKTWANEMQRRAQAMQPAIRQGTQKATSILHAKSKAILNKDVYGKAVDKSKTGRAKWRRAGNLRRSERMRMLSDTQGLVENDANYALPRHDLGLGPGHPMAVRGSKRKSTRTAPWRKQAITDTREERLDAYRQYILKALRGA